MNTVRCGKLLCLVFIVVSAFRCTSDSITGGETSGPEDAGEVSVTLIPRSLTLAVFDIAQLTVITRDATGAVIANSDVSYSISGLPVGTVDGTGLVTALPGGCGIGTIIARSGGVISNPSIVTVGSPTASGCEENPGPEEVGSVTLSPQSLMVEVYGAEQLTTVVRDTTGAVIANPQVVFSSIGLPDGTVDSTGLVTGLPGGCGVGSVVAWSGRVKSNTAVVTIGFSSAGCWDY